MKFINHGKNLLCDMWLVTRSTFGRTVREIGLQLDREGSLATGDIAYLEPLNRHRNVLPLLGQHPILPKSVYVAPNATVIGSVYAGRNTYFGFGSVAQGGYNPVRIGANTKIGDNTVLDTAYFVPSEAFSPSLNIGRSNLIQETT